LSITELNFNWSIGLGSYDYHKREVYFSQGNCNWANPTYNNRSINIPFIVKISHHKIDKLFTFISCFNRVEHFEYTMLLGLNFLEKHKTYRYDDQEPQR